MLVLSRKVNETMKMVDDIEIRVLEVKGDSVRIGIEAPMSMEILRGELILTISETNTDANKLNHVLFNKLSNKK